MAFKTFRFNNGHTVGHRIILVAGNTLILKLDGAKVDGEVLDYGLEINGAPYDLEIIPSTRHPKRLERVITLKVSPHCVTRSYFTLRATVPKGAPNALPVSSVEIEILPRLVLPPMNTDVGLVVRVLLAEAQSPLDPGYGNGAPARESMDLIRQVFDNRVFASSTNLGPLINLVPKNASLRDIVFARNQVDGFQGGNISGKALKNINSFIKMMNDGTDSNFKKVRAHVEYALAVAKRPPSYPSQITTSTLTHWRTKAQPNPPSGNVVPAKEVAGQQFWTLSEKFLRANKP